MAEFHGRRILDHLRRDPGTWMRTPQIRKALAIPDSVGVERILAQYAERELVQVDGLKGWRAPPLVGASHG
jgi:hypothetical protein